MVGLGLSVDRDLPYEYESEFYRCLNGNQIRSHSNMKKKNEIRALGLGGYKRLSERYKVT